VQVTGVSGVRADGKLARQRHARHADTPHAPGEDGVRELRDVPGAATCMGTVSVSRGLRLFWKPSFRWKIPSCWGKSEKDSNELLDGQMTRSAELWQGGRKGGARQPPLARVVF